MNEMMIDNGSRNNVPENFDLQQLMNIIGQTSINVNGISKQIGIIATTVDTLRTDVGDLSGRMDILEQKEEITTTQTEEIRNAACKRIYEILGDGKVTHEKYYRTFIRRLYTNTRHEAGLGSSIARTRKCDYQRCIDYIEAWIPSNGCAGLKSEIDERAKAKRIARDQGYDD